MPHKTIWTWDNADDEEAVVVEGGLVGVLACHDMTADDARELATYLIEAADMLEAEAKKT